MRSDLSVGMSRGGFGASGSNSAGRTNIHEANANIRFASIEARMDRNSELISQLSERVATMETMIRLFHPSAND